MIVLEPNLSNLSVLPQNPYYRQNYGPGEFVTVFHGESDRPDYEQNGDFPENIIAEMVGVEHQEIARDICTINGEDEGWEVNDGADAMYDDSSLYEPVYYLTQPSITEKWREFTEKLKHESRFFAFEAKEMLDELFAGLEGLETADGQPVIYQQEELSLVRARTARNDAEAAKILGSPGTELSAPPKEVAAHGRMNPAGVSVFYGAEDIRTSIAEIRPAVGELVIAATFYITRSIKVLDLTRLQHLHQAPFEYYFSGNGEYDQMDFLRRLEYILCSPMTKCQAELDYIPIQAVVEYFLRYLDDGIDAIAYSSAQTEGSGKNYAVFSKEGVLPLSFKEGSQQKIAVSGVEYSFKQLIPSFLGEEEALRTAGPAGL